VTSTPPTGWYADPWDTRQLRYWDGYAWSPYTAAPSWPAYQPEDSRPALDVAMAQMQQEDARSWGWRPIIAPILALIAIIVATQIAFQFEPDHGNGALIFVVIGNVILEGLVVVALYLSGRHIAARYGGWSRTFGFGWPKLIDVPLAALGVIASFVLRVIIGVGLNLLSNGRATREGSNLDVKGSLSIPAILLLIAVVVIAAPLTEELMFRGLLLRTFMRRWSFWPAAIVSTAIFGLFHAYEVRTVLGAVALCLSVGALGFVNCILVRYTNRLAPGIFVHAASNAFAVLMVIVLSN
jgi:membrane protease YdiL (CAAX protease family)